ncbi:formate dehydrogenase accessory sulfurtransferase FdhD [Parvibacter caecicola]|uniref:FdhD protein n=1 Tax=Parvibacter caecicola TaxID=747645 RepID=A0A3N0A8D9_9ACTN|nr:formate dehydrogenase accessory sulfurtransferase FdhD [Parvibacter caecicola]MBB3172184.1 FdhD protein [Parvibacter caecicola]MCR2041913.1 formate dehydrogenase accessory sulfurtransferase FdhD [Parvibacter caecicola]RNL09598.1 formate dehydrogenase accessory sulfurtransferase FdhD [Parvibacter caecicola]TJW11413.1 formate dehydrogenase accessory sulfurtransferase FdhD [Parvibacter caecicola]
MKVIDQYREEEAVEQCGGLLLHPGGGCEAVSRAVLAEHALEVSVNTVPTLRMVCTPDHLVDLVVGRLFTEGVVSAVDDIAEVYLCDQGSRASVLLDCRRADFSRAGIETVPTCCTGNRVYNQYFTSDSRPAAVVPIPWEPEWVFKAARAFAEDTPLHRATTGTHSCYLMIDGAIVVCREDLGRHNAFDKVVGAALRADIDLRNALVFSSGRLPVDMVMKAIRAGIPILATKAVPTDETIRLAREFGLTLICQARPDSVVVYNDPS